MPRQRDLVIGTAGHIDHGKTALVRALTGVDTDRLPAEKQRGITIDLGFASLEIQGRRVALVDVPGHERFIRNMLAGASGLDLAMLVVASDDSVMPQTREHLEILEILGLAGGVVVLTKCDLADPGWLALVEDEVRTLVRGTFLESSEIVRTSATTGLGIEELKASLVRLCESAPDRDDPGLFRMAIDRSFTVAGHGTIVTGTVASGEVAVGDELELFPGARSVRVRGLHRHDRAVERVARGARAAINLVGVHHAEVARGHELATPGYLADSRILSVEVQASDEAPRPLRHRGRYRVHLGTAEVSATLSLLEEGGASKRLAQLILAAPVASVHAQPFVIREESPPATLGGGRVLVPLARRRIRRRDLAEIERLRRLASADPSIRISAALAGYGLAGWTERMVVRDSGVPIGEVGREVEGLERSGALVNLPIGPRRTARVLAEVASDLEGRVVRAIARLHEASPRFSSIARARVASALADLDNDALVSSLIDRLALAGRVVADRRSVALAGHEPKLSQAERKLKREIAEAYRLGGFSPPDPSEWSTKGNPRSSTVADLLALLVDEEQIVEVRPAIYLDRDIEAELRRKVAERLADGSSMTMADLRDLLGTSRKFAVPIGEYLDRIGWTRREGDARIIGEQATSLLVEGRSTS
jgi:selenocysteine-specific elongation factor